jgi:CRISPR-associated endoribonuclease Cas6
MTEDQPQERPPFASTTTPTRLYAFLLRIRPVQAGSLMAFSGELVHGAFLRWLRQTAPEVSEWLHDGNKRRLFTCSSLQFGLPPHRMLNAERENVHLPLDPQKTYFIRITLLLGELFPLLHESLLQFYPQTGQDPSQFLQIGKQRFALEEVVMTPTHPSGQCGFASLSKLVEQAQSLHGPALETLTLEFDTLTTFNRTNRNGYGTHHALLPLPHYLFPNLARRWEDIAPPELASLVQAHPIEEYALQDGVIITDYDLHPHRVHFTTHQQPGFVGRCTYRLRDPTRRPDAHSNEPHPSPLSLPQQIWLLAQLTFYSGIGYKTSMGLGRAKMI